MPENDYKDMRDLAAMFAMCGLLMYGDDDPVPTAFKLADEFMAARCHLRRDMPNGIAAIKPKRKYRRKATI